MRGPQLPMGNAGAHFGFAVALAGAGGTRPCSKCLNITSKIRPDGAFKEVESAMPEEFAQQTDASLRV
eukprot:9387937-Pyramimonas_sp.AAC.1